MSPTFGAIVSILTVDSRNADEFITSETAKVGTTTEPTDHYSYNASNEVSSGPVAGSGSTSYAYNADGGITADGSNFASAAYDEAGQLCWTSTSTSSSNTCANPPSGATTYAYNADGEQTGVTPPSADPTTYGWDTLSNEMVCANTNGTTCSTSDPTSTTTLYSYDANRLRTSATQGSTMTSFTWDTAAANPQLATYGTWDYLYSPGSAVPIEQVSASGPSPTSDLLVGDPSGNVRGIVQLSAGTYQDELVNYTDYDAYGDPITDSGGSSETGGVSSAQTGINANYVGTTVWGFGEGHTDATGLVYLVHRY